MKYQFNWIIFILVLVANNLCAQPHAEQKYDAMINAFLLGLETKGLEISHTLLSDGEYESVREETLYFLAEKFFSETLKTDNNEKAKKAYLFYQKYQHEYPNGKFTAGARSRITLLESLYSAELLISQLFEEYEAERQIVQKKFELSQVFLEIDPPNPYTFFVSGNFNQTPVEIVNKYFDEIIVNHPEFKIYAYYYKILTYLDPFSNTRFLHESAVPYNRVAESNSPALVDFSDERTMANELLQTISKEHPHHPLTLELHLIFAKLFMEKSGFKGKINKQTLYHLEFILQNEQDKLSPRYILAKEFVENNTFQE